MPMRHGPKAPRHATPAPAAARLVPLAAALAVSATAATAQMPPPARATPGCLPAHGGYLRARIRGARDLDINWRDAELQCEGEVRADGARLLVSFVGPLRAPAGRLRLLFVVRANGADGRQSALPTNLTVIFEGERHLYATQGDDKCTVDELRGERLAASARENADAYRVSARGFCVGPASAPFGNERILVESFDFAGRIRAAAPERAHAPASQ